MRVRRTPSSSVDQKPSGATRKKVSFAPTRKSVSLEFNGGCTVLSISPSNSILSEKALQAFKYAFLRNQKIGIGSFPSCESPSQTEIDKAVAAYDIARQLVDWSEDLDVDGDYNMESNTEEEHRSCDKKSDIKDKSCDKKSDFVVKEEHRSSDKKSDLIKEEHRSCDLKKADGMFPFFGLDAKDDESNSGEVKDLTTYADSFLDLPNPAVDLKLSKSPLSFLDDFLIGPSTPYSCEGMDFFAGGSPTLDDLVSSQKWNGKFDRIDVDVCSLAASEDTMPLMHDSDCDNLASPLSSPGSPSSPYSPEILQ